MPTSPPRNAQFVVENGKLRIQEGVWGSGPDISGTTRSIQAALASGKTECAIAISHAEPDVTAKDLAGLGISRTLSTFTTHFRLGMDNRDANIALAAKAVRGRSWVSARRSRSTKRPVHATVPLATSSRSCS